MRLKELWHRIAIPKWVKYVVTLVAFAIVVIFVGDQSILEFVRRGREIKKIKKQTEIYKEGIEHDRKQLETLENMDSLERFGRELYFMHAKNEDVYLIDE